MALNDWLRASAVGASSGNLAGIIDVCAPVEVNASNVLTVDGGYWLTNIVKYGDYTCSASGAGSDSGTLTCQNPTWTIDQVTGMEAVMTSGSANGQTRLISAMNSTRQIAMAPAFSPAPDTYNNTFSIYSGIMTTDGIHPSPQGHALISPLITASLFV